MSDNLVAWLYALEKDERVRRSIAAHRPYASKERNIDVCWVDLDPYPCATLRKFALPYADRPGYRQKWSA